MIVVEVADVTAASVALKTTSSPVEPGKKLLPLIVTAVPAAPMFGLTPTMVGAAGADVTVNDSELVADPFGEVTVTGPLVAPEGTVATIEFALAELIVAAVPLKLTESLLTVELKPEPEMVT